ncbi:hypothetical protein KXV27_000616 [Aspergillus fumigatus]|nr:hypothetical protein KXW45_001462 [Aspergillus fumigatus]KAH3055563.1 hypothetical protein KXV27_000616 [Aspergillus fumigatus]
MILEYADIFEVSPRMNTLYKTRESRCYFQFDCLVITDVEFDINYNAIAGGDQRTAIDAVTKGLEVGSIIASIDLMSIAKPGTENDPLQSE